jgi:hypothetical protein
MRTRASSTTAWLATLLTFVVIACSSQAGSTVDGNPHSAAGAASSNGGSSAGSVGNAGSAARASTTTGASSSPVGASIPTDACQGLPIDLSADGEGGAASVDTASAGDGGAPSDMPSGGTTDGQACNGVSLEAEAVPVDVFVIMDRSQSMALAVEGSNTTRWQALHEAVKNFTESPRAAQIRAGIGFFSLSGSADDARDCNPDAYARPTVAIGPISEIGPELVAAMNEVAPGGLTPTVPALRGAISYARAWAEDKPGRATVVVLVTDGFPTQCDNEPDQISQAARAGYESPEHIRTFVIGVGDVAKFNLDNYARSGGTKSAYLTDAGNVTTTFVDALNNITNRALACEYQLPPPPDGMKLDSAKVQVIYTPSSGDAEEVPRISSLPGCASTPNGGWYYDDPDHPSKIAVCPCTCARLQAGRVDVRLGCKPRLGLR